MNQLNKIKPHRLRRGGLALVMFVSLLAMPVSRADDAKDAEIDARLEGFQQRVALQEPVGATLTWLLFGFLATVGLGATFMSSKRSHLD